jgi:CubicO group peptidase (beta-lactamase class C family)
MTLAVVAGLSGSAAADGPADPVIDHVFAKYASQSSPGCALGVERAGETARFRAFGSADLEHAVPITPDTVFEAGSVTKQFTAAAVLTLVADGRVKLDDPARRYFPELPAWADQITVSELLDHTSGLRDWGNVEDLAGWPRSERVYGMADVLMITARQKALNYAPGTAWSYTNTGYNLLAMLVERASGKPFAAFTHERLFAPLGMTHTSWRDNFRRVVPGRAIAYEKTKDGWEQHMPFEDGVGNGGLLTTVGDLLIWNDALTAGRLGPYVTAEIQRPSHLKDGRPLEYARGLFVTQGRGVREVSHSGATGGYRAWLGRWPEQALSIAMLCNAGDAATGPMAHEAAEEWLPPAPHEPTPVVSSDSQLRLAGWWRGERWGQPLHLEVHDGALWSGKARLDPAPGGFRFGGAVVGVSADGDRLEVPETGDLDVYRRAEAWTPTSGDLAAVVGRFHSDEAAATWIVTRDGDRLRMTAEDRPEASHPLEPAYRDAFTTPGTVVRLVRDGAGKVTALRLSNSRVWDLRFERVE